MPRINWTKSDLVCEGEIGLEVAGSSVVEGEVEALGVIDVPF